MFREGCSRNIFKPKRAPRIKIVPVEQKWSVRSFHGTRTRGKGRRGLRLFQWNKSVPVRRSAAEPEQKRGRSFERRAPGSGAGAREEKGVKDEGV